MVTVQGRILKEPSVAYNNENMPVQIDNKGRWNVRSRQVCQSKPLKDWSILRIARYQKDLQGSEDWFGKAVKDFIGTLMDTLGKENVDYPRGRGITTIAEVNEDTLKRDFEFYKSRGFRLVVVALPEYDASTYKLIKKIGDIDFGISTVCVRFEKKKFEQGAFSYFANVALKINLKLGGINHKLKDQNGLYANTMVIGVDVTHPSPGATKKTAPSVAAMVASVDSQVLLLHSHLSPIEARC